MGANYSKPLYYTCYEIGHTWTPSCLEALTGIGLSSYWISFKIYLSVYMLTAILRRKNLQYFKKRLIPEVIRSAVFLGTNVSTFIASFCFWRSVLPYFNQPLGGFLPAATASFISILFERSQRRGLLALYLSNLACETIFKMLQSRGHVSSVKHGEVWIFSITTAFYMYLYRSLNGLEPNISSPLSFLVGKSELPDEDTINNTRNTAFALDSSQFVTFLPPVFQKCLTLMRGEIKHKLCHHQFSCFFSAVELGVRNFGLGFLLHAAFKTLSSIPLILKSPKHLLSSIKNNGNIKFGVFIGLFTFIFKITNCVLRWFTNKDTPVFGFVGGFFAGWSMLFYKSSAIALYLATKLTEILYFKGITRGKLPYIKHFDILLYTLSTALIVHTAVFEPHNLRPAYWRFLLKLTGGKFALMNRRLLDVYGTKASTLNPNFEPELDPRYTYHAQS